MGYNRFFINILIRVLLASANNFLLIYFILAGGRFFTIVLLGLLLVLQIFLLFRYLNKTNYELAKFLLFVSSKDTLVVYLKGEVEKTFKGLHSSFDRINREVKQIKNEKELNIIYLENLINHIGTGIISFDENGAVELFNLAAGKLLDLSKPGNIHELNSAHHGLEEFLKNLKTEQSGIFEIKTYEQFSDTYSSCQLTFKSTIFKLFEKEVKLVSFQNIQTELDAKELEAWQKLIRVLTHEVSNSITSISTLTSTIRRFLSDNNKTKKIENINQEILDDTLKCSKIIEERSNGLIEFINYYRSITRLPEPKKSSFKVIDLYSDLFNLFERDLIENKVKFTYNSDPPDLKLHADMKLVEQLMINLIKNSFYWLVGINNPEISLHAKSNQQGYTFMQITDNGKGISHDIIKDIYTPFFTTKEGGSGIGLSLAKQIMYLHKGAISCVSEPRIKTSFTLRF